MDNDHKQQEKQAILTELESIKELLHEDGQFSADDLQQLDIPVLQEVFSADENTDSQTSPTLPAAPMPETDVDNDDDADQLSSAYAAFTAIDSTSSDPANSEDESTEDNDESHQKSIEDKQADSKSQQQEGHQKGIHQQGAQQTLSGHTTSDKTVGERTVDERTVDKTTIDEQNHSQDTNANASDTEHESVPPALSVEVLDASADTSSLSIPTPNASKQGSKKAQQSLFDEEPSAPVTPLDNTPVAIAASPASSSANTSSLAAQEQAITNTPLSNSPLSSSSLSSSPQGVLKPSAKQRAQTAKPTGENPFLPKHIRDRIQANQLEKANLVKSFSENNQPQRHSTSQAESASASQEAASQPHRTPEPETNTPARASSVDNIAKPNDTANTMDDAALNEIIDSIVAAQLPALEKQLRDALRLRLTEQPLSNTQSDPDDSTPS